MEPQFQKRVAELFERMLNVEPSKRPAAIDAVCGDDVELRRELESLLEADARAARMFAGNVIARIVEDSSLDQDELLQSRGGGQLSEALVGTTVGQYRIIRIIDHGGMGVVFEAEQQQPRRRVALKILRERLPSDRALRRFRDEADTLSKVVHPAVARVFEAGIADVSAATLKGPMPFIAMELIENARSLIDYARDTKLAIRAILELFAAVCDAVAHGHEVGVIHRDLKPSNILVDGKGNPKLIDFGVARVIADEGGATITRTANGHLVGTLQYLAPELCESGGEVGTRSDVYSLGVVLYEMICGKPPHDLADAHPAAALDTIRNQPILPPHRVSRNAPFDVSTIVQTALARDPQRRYRSAAEFAADIRRYLAGHPIAARGPGVFYRLRLFMRRNWLAGVSAGIMIIVGLTSVASLWVDRLQRDAESRAKIRKQFEAIAADYSSRREAVGNTPPMLFEMLRPDEAPAHGGSALTVMIGPTADIRELAFCDDYLQPTKLLDRDIAHEAPAGFFSQPPIAGRMNLADAMLVDCMPETAGREVVVALNGPSESAGRPFAVLRVYDLEFHKLAETWVSGTVYSIRWNARVRQLICLADLRTISSYVPELAAMDSAGCPFIREQSLVIVALQPTVMHDAVFPAGIAGVANYTPVDWAAAISADYADTPRRQISTPRLTIDHKTPEFVDDIPVMIDLYNLAAIDSRVVIGKTNGAASLSPTGLQTTKWNFEPERAAPSSPIKFVRMDFNALAPARKLAEDTFRESDDLDNALRMLECADPNLRTAARSMLKAMYGNWRFMHYEADRLSERLVSEDCADDALMDRARRWAASAVQIHDARCPAPDRCDARWFVLSTRADVDRRAGCYRAALDAYLESNEINARIPAKEDYRTDHYRALATPIAECLMGLGDLNGAREALEHATELWRDAPALDARNAELARIARMQSLLRGD